MCFIFGVKSRTSEMDNRSKNVFAAAKLRSLNFCYYFLCDLNVTTQISVLLHTKQIKPRCK